MPGGVGPMTIAMLLLNTVEAAERTAWIIGRHTIHARRARFPIQKVRRERAPVSHHHARTSQGNQRTPPLVNSFADLPHDFMGNPYEPLIEVFNDHAGRSFHAEIFEMLTRFAKPGRRDRVFRHPLPYFIEKRRRCPGALSVMSYDCVYLRSRVG